MNGVIPLHLRRVRDATRANDISDKTRVGIIKSLCN